MSRPPLLVTGFGPFPGVPDNPSAALVRRIAALRPDVATQLLPTLWTIGPEVAALAKAHRTVLMFGVAARARRIRYECRVRPEATRAPDAAGALPRAAPAHSQRPAFPVPPLAAAARRAGFPVALSGNAGAYICNLAYGAALSANPRTLFVHIPMPAGRGTRRDEHALLAHALWLVDALTASHRPRRQ